MSSKKLQLDSPLYGLAAAYVAVTRDADGYFLNAAGAFVLALPTFPALTEDPNIKGRYTFTSADAWADGLHTVRFYQRIGVSQDVTSDPLIGVGSLQIKDDAEIIVETVAEAVKAKTDNLPTDPADESLLEAAIGTRLAAASYTAPDNAGIAAIKAKTDNLPSDPASNTQVNTRLAAIDYTAPDNAGIAAVKAKTDNLPTDPADESLLEAAIAAIPAPDNVGIAAIKAKTDNLPTDPADESLLEAAIATRLAAADYIAPDNAGIAAIQERTDNLPDDPADESLLEAAIATRASQSSVDAIAAAITASDYGSYGLVVDGLVNVPTLLRFQFLKTGQPFNAAAIVKIEIYNDYTKAQIGNPADVLETILGAAVIHEGTGLYRFSAAALANFGAYFYKIHLTPVTGDPTWTAIHSWAVQREAYIPGGPDTVNQCRVWGYSKYPESGLISRDKITAQLDQSNVQYKASTGVWNHVVTVYPTITGYWEMYLAENDNMETGSYYIFTINGRKYKKYVPDVGGINFYDLADVP